MDGEGRAVAVSPRHTVVLAAEMAALIERAPRHDFVLRTVTRREANGLPLMTAELVIASEETRAAHPAAAVYPLHFRKTYFPGRLHADPKRRIRSSPAGLPAVPVCRRRSVTSRPSSAAA